MPRKRARARARSPSRARLFRGRRKPARGRVSMSVCRHRPLRGLRVARTASCADCERRGCERDSMSVCRRAWAAGNRVHGRPLPETPVRGCFDVGMPTNGSCEKRGCGRVWMSLCRHRRCARAAKIRARARKAAVGRLAGPPKPRARPSRACASSCAPRPFGATFSAEAPELLSVAGSAFEHLASVVGWVAGAARAARQKAQTQP